MCIKGGKRCKVDNDKVNSRRRDHYAVNTAKKILDQVIEEHGSDFTGDVEGIGFLINTPLIAKSYALAARAHAGVRRSRGDVYLDHPLRVAYGLQKAGFNEEVIAVALLHDAVEDSEMTFSYLRKLGFNERIVTGVDSVTKRPGEDYSMAIVRASKHPIGRLVKLYDNKDNSSDEQLEPFSDAKKQEKRAKYTPARVFIIQGIIDTPAKELMEHEQGFHTDYEISKDVIDFADIFN